VHPDEVAFDRVDGYVAAGESASIWIMPGLPPQRPNYKRARSAVKADSPGFRPRVSAGACARAEARRPKSEGKRFTGFPRASNLPGTTMSTVCSQGNKERPRELRPRHTPCRPTSSPPGFPANATLWRGCGRTPRPSVSSPGDRSCRTRPMRRNLRRSSIQIATNDGVPWSALAAAVRFTGDGGLCVRPRRRRHENHANVSTRRVRSTASRHCGDRS